MSQTLFLFKGTLKKYVDDFFTIILTANESIPPVIKSLFDFLDEAATKYEVEPEVVYNWKCNRWLYELYLLSYNSFIHFLIDFKRKSCMVIVVHDSSSKNCRILLHVSRFSSKTACRQPIEASMIKCDWGFK